MTPGVSRRSFLAAGGVLIVGLGLDGLGRAGAQSVGFTAERMSVTPIELDSRGAKALRERVPEAIYESGRETVRVRLPDEPEERFRAVVTAAEAILEVATEPKDRP